MSSLFGPGVMLLFFLFFAGLVFLYIMSIFWAKKDAKARGANEKFAMLISLIPFAGVLAYVLMRPPLLKIDEEEQKLDIRLKSRQVKKFDYCPTCGAEIESDYIVCPKCNHRLKESCSRCNKPLDLSWSVCPYCGTRRNNIKSEILSDNTTNEDVKHKEFETINEGKAGEIFNRSSVKVDYKVEDSFSFDNDAVEEADVNLGNVAKPKHHFKKQINIHN